MIIAHTRRLVLRRFVQSDAPFILKLLNDPSYLANIGDRGVRSLEDAMDFCLTVLQRGYLENGYGLYCVALADGADKDKAIGQCGLVNREALDGVELGYAFLPHFWGKGFAKEACDAVMHHAQNECGLDSLKAIVSKQNDASKGLLLRLGFEQAGDFVFPENGETLDLYRRAL